MRMCVCAYVHMCVCAFARMRVCACVRMRVCPYPNAFVSGTVFRSRKKKQCELGYGCKYKHEHQHASEFSHDEPEKEPSHFGGTAHSLLDGPTNQGPPTKKPRPDGAGARTAKRDGASGTTSFKGKSCTLGGGTKGRPVSRLLSLPSAAQPKNSGQKQPKSKPKPKPVANSRLSPQALRPDVTHEAARPVSFGVARDWSCPVCTLHNKQQHLQCSACGATQPESAYA